MDDSVREPLDRTEAPVSKAEPQLDPKEPGDFAGDKAGAGRYILSFYLAGPLGLWAVYWARYYGWRGILISLAIFIALVVLFFVAGGYDYIANRECYRYPNGDIVCFNT